MFGEWTGKTSEDGAGMVGEDLVCIATALHQT